jgi:hypothetical protein
MGTIEDWVMEGHRLAQTVAYGDLDGQNPALITASYERQADPVIELQLENAGVRLAECMDSMFLASITSPPVSWVILGAETSRDIGRSTSSGEAAALARLGHCRSSSSLPLIRVGARRFVFCHA